MEVHRGIARVLGRRGHRVAPREAFEPGPGLDQCPVHGEMLGREQLRDQRQVAPGIVVPIEEAELLLPVGGIVGRIQVDGDAAGAAPEPRVMVLDHQVGQARPARYSAGRPTAFSKRDRVACEASARPSRGSRSSSSL